MCCVADVCKQAASHRAMLFQHNMHSLHIEEHDGKPQVHAAVGTAQKDIKLDCVVGGDGAGSLDGSSSAD